MFVAKKLLSRQIFVATNIILSREKHVFVATKLLSQQKLYLWQLSPMTQNYPTPFFFFFFLFFFSFETTFLMDYMLCGGYGVLPLGHVTGTRTRWCALRAHWD